MLKHENPEDKEMNDLLRRSILDTIAKNFPLRIAVKVLKIAASNRNPQFNSPKHRLSRATPLVSSSRARTYFPLLSQSQADNTSHTPVPDRVEVYDHSPVSCGILSARDYC
ncbi:hypothetical protein TNCV_2429291 [Trichonephila clavipes]|nr:hypothetical protein TNCV_2429291 [Trichonephila clavipes]